MSTFDLAQISAAHSKVKSGADFPSYIQALKALGVTAYEHFVANGEVTYHGNNGHVVSALAKWEKKEIAQIGDVEHLKASLKIHQAGKTDYFTFCQESAQAGVEKWRVDTQKMTCGYYDGKGNELLIEKIPE